MAAYKWIKAVYEGDVVNFSVQYGEGTFAQMAREKIPIDVQYLIEPYKVRGSLMLSIKINASAGLDNFFKRYPQLYDRAKKKATDQSLDLLQAKALSGGTTHEAAPYKTGNLRREIKQDYTNRRLVAGTHISRDYAYVQEFGNRKGTIRAKRVFYGALKENTKKVLDIFKKQFRRALSGK